MQSTTKTSQRIKDRIAKYRANPIRGDVRLAGAVRLIQGKAEDDMARKARKAPTAAQLKARAAFTARYGKKRGGSAASATADNPRKKRRKRRSNPAAAAPTASNPKRRRRRKANPAAARPAAANPKRRRKRRRSNPAAARPAAANPSRRRRRRRANPRVATYTRKKTVRGHYRRPSKKTRRRSKRRDNPVTGRGITVHTHMHGGSPVQDNPRRRRRRRRSNPASTPYIPTHVGRAGMLDNPTYSGLFDNPMGPYGTESLKAFGIASAGLAVGLLVARGVDRFIATMKPADSKGLAGTKAANHPWYGKNAVAAIYRRPNAVRLGVQAAGAVAAIGGAYALRNKSVAPWLLGGIALGFGSNLLLQVAEWYVIPRILKLKDANEQTLANRLYVLEQVDTQDKVDAIMEDWASKPALDQQQASATPVIVGPLNVDATGKATGDDIATLGRGAAGSRPSGATLSGQPRRFVPDGRVGNCGECGGQGGHYSGCAQCQVCNGGGGGRRCSYEVQTGVDLYEVARTAGVAVSRIIEMNGGRDPASWWIVGEKAILPEEACHIIINGGVPRVPTEPVREPPPPEVIREPISDIRQDQRLIAGVGNNKKSVAFALAGGEDD